jgi:hypothetical protein
VPHVKLKFKNADDETVELGGDVRIEVAAVTGLASYQLHPESLYAVEYVADKAEKAAVKAEEKQEKKAAADEKKAEKASAPTPPPSKAEAKKAAKPKKKDWWK